MDEDLEALKERGWRQVAAIDAALERGEIDEEGWHRAMADLIVPAYLAGQSPRAQSGHSGDEERWEGARRLILDAVDADGSFLDVGCASGHLMECVHRWAAEDGIRLEPWGLEISVELAALARDRLPRWAERNLRRKRALVAGTGATRLRADEPRLRASSTTTRSPRRSARNGCRAPRSAHRWCVQRGGRAARARGGCDVLGLRCCRTD